MLPYGRKTPLPFLYSLSSLILASAFLRKGEIHKRVETIGVYPLVRTASAGEFVSLLKRGFHENRTDLTNQIHYEMRK